MWPGFFCVQREGGEPYDHRVTRLLPSAATPQAAILSTVIFNVPIIIAPIPLALREVKYRAMSADYFHPTTSRESRPTGFH
jgi:hypothetical protein